MPTALTIKMISDALQGNAFWLDSSSEAARIVTEATRRGYIRRLSHTQAQWTEEGLARARAELEPNETTAALKAFAQKHGRQWKAELRRQWEMGGTSETEGVLHRLRNTHGPRWLAKYKLPV